MKPHRSDQRGFTLIELLVALGIVAVLVTLLYETFNSVLRSTRLVDEAAEIDQMVRSSLGLMTNELRSAYWRPPTDTAGGTSPFLFVGEDGLSGGRPGDSLNFTVLSHARVGEGVTDPILSALAYELAAVPETSTAVLMHEEETNLLSLSDQSLERYELAERVIGLNLRYFDGKDWTDEWDASDQKKLPKAVEIQILFLDPSGRERQFTTQTDIPVGQTS